MNIWKTIVIAAVVFGLGFGIYNLWMENKKLDSKVDNVSETYEDLKQENNGLQAQINHFENTENLKEEAKKSFNYKEPGEELMIIVPGESGSDSKDN